MTSLATQLEALSAESSLKDSLKDSYVDHEHENDSGYSSGSSSDSLPEVAFTKPHLTFLNRQLQALEPQDILRWAITSLPNLYQTTAFGLTGLVTVDMLSKMDIPRQSAVDLIFLDTLHHFSETLALVDRVRQRYSVNVHVYKPADCNTVEDFTALYGEKSWEVAEEFYDYMAKVEPAQRAYRELRCNAVLTGRRRSQGGKRGSLPVIEVDDAGLIKVNPFANWNFDQVQRYIKEHNVPYNELLDRGYKSVGDWHSTKPVGVNEDERSGRWAGKAKTECGIHNPRSRYGQYLRGQELKRQEEVLQKVLEKESVQHSQAVHLVV